MKRTEHTQKWLDALRSGEYEQTWGDFTDGECFCALGVAACVAGIDISEYKGSICSEIETAMGMTEDERVRVVQMNDEAELEFPEIADAIEQMLDGN